MNTSKWAKIFGWGQFAIGAVNQLGQTISANGNPHGFWGWLAIAGQFLGGVAIHHASNTDGQK